MNYKIKILPIVFYLIIVLCSFAVYVQNNGIKPQQIFALVITIIGFILWIIARIQLGNAFTVNPKANFLVTTGFYSKFRHPVYLFSSLTFVGVAAFFESILLLGLTILILIFQMYRIRKEEQVLSKKFGKKYFDYKKTTWL